MRTRQKGGADPVLGDVGSGGGERKKRREGSSIRRQKVLIDCLKEKPFNGKKREKEDYSFSYKKTLPILPGKRRTVVRTCSEGKD